MTPGPWQFFTGEEARVIEAMVERLVPADDLSISGKEAGCALYLDRQLAGFFGDASRLYMRGPFMKGTPAQGDQSPLTPRQRYRRGLAALDKAVRAEFGGKGFADLGAADRDAVLARLEKGEIAFEGEPSSAAFFDMVLSGTMEGFFADPIYGGNKDMASWKMIGFPGVRYDFRDHATKHNQRYTLAPVSIQGRADWKVR